MTDSRIHYAVFNFTTYTSGVAFPSKYLNEMLASAYMVYTGYVAGYRRELEKAESIIDQTFYSVTPADMRKLLGPTHTSKDVFVIATNYTSSLAVPVNMLKQLLTSAYIVKMEYPLSETTIPDDAVVAGDQVITSIKTLSHTKFDVFDLEDIRACQAQSILSHS